MQNTRFHAKVELPEIVYTPAYRTYPMLRTTSEQFQCAARRSIPSRLQPVREKGPFKVARNSFHLPQTSFTNSFPITVWFIVSV